MNKLNFTYLQKLCRVCLKPACFLQDNCESDDYKADEFPNNNLLRPPLCQLFYSLTTLDISLEVECLPKQLCKKCLLKLRSFDDFRKEVLRNTQTLHEMLNCEQGPDRNVKSNNEIEDNINLEEIVIKSEINWESVKTENLFPEQTSVVKEESAYSLDEETENDGNDNALLLPEVAQFPIAIKIEQTFECSDTQLTVPYVEKVDSENFLQGTNKIDDSRDDDKLLIPSSSAEQNSTATKSQLTLQYTDELESDISLQSTYSGGVEDVDNKSPSCDPSPSNPVIAHTDGKTKLNVKQKVDSKTTRIFCQICKKKFLNKMYLDAHVLKNHYGHVRPFKCPHCPAAFNISNDLNLHLILKHSAQKCHERVHSSERPLRCDVCKKGFAQEEQLISHMKWHKKAGLWSRSRSRNQCCHDGTE